MCVADSSSVRAQNFKYSLDHIYMPQRLVYHLVYHSCATTIEGVMYNQVNMVIRN